MWFFQLLFQLLKLPVEQANTSCCSIRISCTQEFRLRTLYAFTKKPQQASLLPAGWLLAGDDTHSASEWNKKSVNPRSGETEKPQGLGWHSSSHSVPGWWAANAVSTMAEMFTLTHTVGYGSYRAKEVQRACQVHWEEVSYSITHCAVPDSLILRLQL